MATGEMLLAAIPGVFAIGIMAVTSAVVSKTPRSVPVKAAAETTSAAVKPSADTPIADASVTSTPAQGQTSATSSSSAMQGRPAQTTGTASTPNPPASATKPVTSTKLANAATPLTRKEFINEVKKKMEAAAKRKNETYDDQAAYERAKAMWDTQNPK